MTEAFQPGLVAFYLIAATVAGLAVIAVTSANLLRAVIALAFSFFAVAGLFWILGSPFLAVLQLVINASAVPIVTIFIVMMTQSRRAYVGGFGAVVAGLLVAVPFAAAVLVFGVSPYAGGALSSVTPLTIERLGYELLSIRGREAVLSTGEEVTAVAGTIVAFEVIALLLLVAFVGAVILARREDPTLRPHRATVAGKEVADADA